MEAVRFFGRHELVNIVNTWFTTNDEPMDLQASWSDTEGLLIDIGEEVEHEGDRVYIALAFKHGKRGVEVSSRKSDNQVFFPLTGVNMFHVGIVEQLITLLVNASRPELEAMAQGERPAPPQGYFGML